MRYLSDEDLERTAPAESAPLATPIPTQIVSNGEYSPLPQIAASSGASSARSALADGLRRPARDEPAAVPGRGGGMAAAFLAMNRVFGPLFDVAEAEAASPGVADERAAAPGRQFIFDVPDPLRARRLRRNGILELGEVRQALEPGLREGVTMQRYKFENYLKEIFLDSDTASPWCPAAPVDDPAQPDPVERADRRGARDRERDRRVAAAARHAVIRPGPPGLARRDRRAIDNDAPDSWKGYTVGDPLSPSKWSVAARRREARVPGLREDGEGRHPHRLHPQGAAAGRLRESRPSCGSYARVDDVGKAAQGLAAAQVRHLSLRR